MNNKTCKTSNRLNAYLDNELSEQESAFIKKHLSHCIQCQNELREIIKMNRFLAKYQEQSPSPQVITDILKISNRKQVTGLRKWTIAGSIAASFIVGILLSSLTFSGYTESNNDYQLGQTSLYSYFIGDQNVQ